MCRGLILICLFVSTLAHARSSLDVVLKHLPGLSSVRTESPSEADEIKKLENYGALADEASPVTPGQLEKLGTIIPDGDCVAIDTRSGKMASRKHVLHIDHSASDPMKMLVYGTIPGSSEIPAGLTPIDANGTFDFGNDTRHGKVKIETTFNDAQEPVLVTSAASTDGVKQYCEYPLKRPLANFR